MSQRRTRDWIYATAVAMLFPTTAFANVLRGHVVHIENEKAYVDLAQKEGVQQNALIRFWRPVSFPHPTNASTIEDQLPLGELRISAVGDSLSVVNWNSNHAEPLQVGDVAEVLLKAPRQKKKQSTLMQIRRAPSVIDTWSSSAGTAPNLRKAAWEDHLRLVPDSPDAAGIRAEVARLQAISLAMENDVEILSFSQPRLTVMEHDPVHQAHEAEPIDFAFASTEHRAIQGAWLHYRHVGEETYERRPLLRQGDFYFRTRVPAKHVRAPGVEYFVEATTEAQQGLAIGTPRRPLVTRVATKTATGFHAKRLKSQVRFRYDYLDYATFDQRTDRDTTDLFQRFESDFFYRVGASALHGIRLGFGVIQGKGGQANPDSVPVSLAFQYGYTEFEFRRSKMVAALARFIAGTGADGIGFGFEGRLRIGPEEATNLMFEFGKLKNVGIISGVRMESRALWGVPIGLGVAVTDQPNKGDLGVRLSTDIGLQLASWFRPTLQVSFQGRSVTHSGLGLGVGATFDW